MKIKNIVSLLFILLLLGLTAFFLFNKVHQTQYKKEVYFSIPSFQIKDINGAIIKDTSLQDYQAVMFLYFNPDCDLCRNEIIQIKENESIFLQGKIVFFSESPADSIQQFLRTINLEPPPNMLFLPDENAVLVNKMEVKTTPTIYIYRQGHLFKRFDGPVKVETLIKYLSN